MFVVSVFRVRAFSRSYENRSIVALKYFFCLFQIAGVDDSTENPSGFVKDENGHLTGQLFEVPAMKKILGSSPQPKADEMKMAIEEQWRAYASRGFTTVTDLLFSMKSDDTEETNVALNVLKRVSESQFCPVRLALYRGLDASGMSANCTLVLFSYGGFDVIARCV